MWDWCHVNYVPIITPIARITSIDINEPSNKAMLSVDVNDSMATVNKEVNLISHEDRVNFLQSKGLTLENPILSSDQQSQLSALLYEGLLRVCGGPRVAHMLLGRG